VPLRDFPFPSAVHFFSVLDGKRFCNRRTKLDSLCSKRHSISPCIDYTEQFDLKKPSWRGLWRKVAQLVLRNLVFQLCMSDWTNTKMECPYPASDFRFSVELYLHTLCSSFLSVLYPMACTFDLPNTAIFQPYSILRAQLCQAMLHEALPVAQRD
jgi:hypothetical protein